MEDKKEEEVNQETLDQQEHEEINEEVEAELSEVEQLQLEKQALQEKVVRLQADFDNHRKRAKKEKEMDLKYKSQDLATELVPVLDNFERALQTEVNDESSQTFVDGMKMVYGQLTQALEQAGVEEIEAEGVEFDPQKHQAIMQVSEEGYESNQVIEVMQKGYQLKDRVIRPAMVKVNE
ncbi:nucleotide exchange factor GrpE [Halalkalibacillus halophilus]|uniref:nucleotide exchange factor GrpE n=1 Tax=Halalkalibacillus halophilus TaxID=392827 RepID=UPI0004253B64|nr:nucleotide exchange factor GrpE [Halalkalibacillus halophilus]